MKNNWSKEIIKKTKKQLVNNRKCQRISAEINDNWMHIDLTASTTSTTSRHAAMVKKAFDRARDPQRMWILNKVFSKKWFLKKKRVSLENKGDCQRRDLEKLEFFVLSICQKKRVFSNTFSETFRKSKNENGKMMSKRKFREKTIREISEKDILFGEKKYFSKE